MGNTYYNRWKTKKCKDISWSANLFLMLYLPGQPVYAYIIINEVLEDEVIIVDSNVYNLRYADDTVVISTSEEKPLNI